MTVTFTEENKAVADPAPVTWPEGVVEMRFGDGRDNITIAGGVHLDQ